MSASDIVPRERPSLANVAIAVALGLIGFYIGAATFASDPSSMLETFLAVAGFVVFGLWSGIAVLEASIVDQYAEGSQ